MSKPRLLIIEDDEPIRESFRDTFAASSDEFGIEGFDVQTAETKDEARELLWNAREAGLPFDVVVQDLAIPLNVEAKGIREPLPEVGVDLLQELKDAFQKEPEKPFAHSIIVVSGFFDPKVLQALIRTQLVHDFVRKTYDFGNREIYASVVQAYRVGQQREWERYKQSRLVRWLTEAARAGIGSLARVVTNSVSDAIGETRQLIQLIEENQHLGVALDQGNPLCRKCLDIQNAVTQITKKCAAERDKLCGEIYDREQVSQSVGDLWLQARFDVRSGLAGKSVGLECEALLRSVVATSLYYARIVLEEILYGAIDATAATQKVTAEMKTNSDGLTVAVCIYDNSYPLLPDQIAAIHQGESVNLRVGGRAWGLAVAQYVALNIGARVEVVTQTSGNCVTLHLPVERL